jgi:hypothetical protein
MSIGRYFDISKVEAGKWYVVHSEWKVSPAISVPGPYPRFIILSNNDAVLTHGGSTGVYFIPDVEVVPGASIVQGDIVGAYLIPDVEFVPDTLSIRTDHNATTGSITVTEQGSFLKFREAEQSHYLNLLTVRIEDPGSPSAWFSKWSLCAKGLDGYEVLLNFGS